MLNYVQYLSDRRCNRGVRSEMCIIKRIQCIILFLFKKSNDKRVRKNKIKTKRCTFNATVVEKEHRRRHRHGDLAF